MCKVARNCLAIMVSEDQENAATIKAFEELGLCTQLAEAAVSLGWKSPTSIQEQAIPNLLQGLLGRFRIFPNVFHNRILVF